jgi:stage II sporulation SpoE-like protein/GAF domain-containing protein
MVKKLTNRSAPQPTPIASPTVVDGVARWADRLEAALDPRRAAEDLLGLLASSVAATRGSLMLVNPRSGRLHIVAGLALPEGCLGEDLPPAPRRISDWVMREGHAMVLDGELRDERFAASAARDRIASALCVPLPGSSGMIGVLNLARTAPATTFTRTDLTAIETVTRAVAAILERVIELGQARPLWRQLAAGTSPTALPAPRARELACSRFEGLVPSMLVCEQQVYADGTLGILLAEPLGGTARALRVGEWLRGMFHAGGSRDMEPAAFAHELHERLLAHQPGGGARAWLATIGANGQLRSCAAGSPAPFCLPSEGEPGQRLTQGGPALGAAGGRPHYEADELRLLPGDALIVVNEGLIQARSSADVRFGDTGVLEQLLDQRHRSLESVVQAVTHAARSHAGLGVTPDPVVAFALRFSRED